jgi:hypothetical protein
MPEFTGRVQDLDYLGAEGHCQVILFQGQDQLIAATKEPLVLSLLGAAFVSEAPVTVMYEGWQPYVLTRVKLNRDSPPQP